MTTHTNIDSTAGDPIARLVDVFATAGVEALGQGVLPDALDELAERVGGEDTLPGVVLYGAADVLEVADP